MADEAPLTSSEGEGLSRKVGPLPLWAWALIAGGVGYYLWRKHSSSSSSGTAADSGAFPGGSSGGGGAPLPTTTPPSGDCKDRRDPRGRVHHVCGNGHWVRGPGGLYSWVQGTLKGPISGNRTVRGGPGAGNHGGSGPGTGVGGGGGGTATSTRTTTVTNKANGPAGKGSGPFMIAKIIGFTRETGAAQAVAAAQRLTLVEQGVFFTNRFIGPARPAPRPIVQPAPVTNSAGRAFRRQRMS